MMSLKEILFILMRNVVAFVGVSFVCSQSAPTFLVDCSFLVILHGCFLAYAV